MRLLSKTNKILDLWTAPAEGPAHANNDRMGGTGGKRAMARMADNPGRGEPGTGEVNYPFLFDALDRDGYPGWIGCEYRPRGDTSAGLGWIRPYLRARDAATA